MASWLPWGLLALLTWGLWGLFPKLAVQSMSPESAILYEAIGAALAGVTIAALTATRLEFDASGAIYAGLTGATAILGGWFYLCAAARADITSVVILTAMYPALTVLFAWIFIKEPVGARHLLALALALSATLVVAWEG